jgi:hypothetical protein
MTDTEAQQANPFAGWVILELMGHRRLAGYLTEQEIAGEGFLRLDVPDGNPTDGPPKATQFYRPAAVYCITPTTEDVARLVAAGSDPAPVKRWELPAPASTSPPAGFDGAWDEDDDLEDRLP